MGCYLGCGCRSGCFICDENFLGRSSFSFSLFGIDVEASFPPRNPDATPEEITGRSQSECITKPITKAFRELVELDWSPPEIVRVSNGVCGGDLANTPECLYVCQGCSCLNLGPYPSAECQPMVREIYERSYKSATVWVVFEQSSLYYDLVCECCDPAKDDVRYLLTASFSHVRIAGTRSQTIQRLRTVEVRCEDFEEDPFPEPTITTGLWFYPPELGGGVINLDDPCIPCDIRWLSMEGCETTVSDCSVDGDPNAGRTMLDFWLPIKVYCGVGNSVCSQVFTSTVDDCIPMPTYASVLIGSYWQDLMPDLENCGPIVEEICMEQIPVGPPRVGVSVEYKSDCIKCADVGSSVELTLYIDDVPAVEDVDVILRDAVEGAECTIPETKFTLPKTLILTLS